MPPSTRGNSYIDPFEKAYREYNGPMVNHSNDLLQKTDRPYGEILAQEQVQAEKEREAKRRAEGKADPPPLPSQALLDYFYGRVKRSTPRLTMKELERMWIAMKPEHTRNCYESIMKLVEELVIEHINWKQRRHPLAKPSQSLVRQQMQAAKKVELDARPAAVRRSSATVADSVTSRAPARQKRQKPAKNMTQSGADEDSQEKHKRKREQDTARLERSKRRQTREVG